MNYKSIKFFILLLFTIIILFSCENSQRQLTDQELMMVDSIFQIKSRDQDKLLDSLCDSVHNVNYPIMVDSIKKVRQKEIMDLIEE